ncbi:MAG: hypothetical protein ABIH18_02745 [Candidatus Omnitrophota bacterium]
MTGIKDLFNCLEKRSNLITVGLNVTKKLVEDCLFEEKLSVQELRGKLIKVISDIERIIKYIQSLDKKRQELKDKICQMIDLDTGRPK